MAKALDWEFCACSPEGVSDAQCLILNEKLFIGGHYNSSHDGAKLLVTCIDLQSSWDVLPTPSSLYALTTYHSEVVLVGGREVSTDNVRTNKLWSSDNEGHNWRKVLPRMPTERDSATAVNIDKLDVILVAGGVGLNGLLVKTVEVLLGEQWHVLEPLEVKCSFLKPAIHNDTLYLMGGYKQKNSVYCCELDKILTACALSDKSRKEKTENKSEKDTTSYQLWSKMFAPLRSSCCASDGERMITCGRAYFCTDPPKVHDFCRSKRSWNHLWYLPNGLGNISCAAMFPTGELMVMDGAGRIVKGFVSSN